MTNKKAALELPPIELQRAIKMLSSQVSFLSLNSIRVIRVCACIVRLCFCVVHACIIVTIPLFCCKSIDLKESLRYFYSVECMR